MAKKMSVEEVQAAKEVAKEIDLFKFENPKDPDNDFFHAVLYKDNVGHFRNIETSGFNSKFNGASDIGERLTEAEVKTWTKF